MTLFVVRIVPDDWEVPTQESEVLALQDCHQPLYSALAIHPPASDSMKLQRHENWKLAILIDGKFGMAFYEIQSFQRCSKSNAIALAYSLHNMLPITPKRFLLITEKHITETRSEMSQEPHRPPFPSLSPNASFQVSLPIPHSSSISSTSSQYQEHSFGIGG